MTLRTTPPPNISLKTTAQRRARIKPDLKSKLEDEYKKNPRPNKHEKHRIALAYDMSDDNVHFWFQNRRARASRESKKRKTSSDQGPSETTSSSSTHQEPTLATSSGINFAQQKNFTTVPSLIDPRPRLPSIGTLFDGQGSSNPPPSSTPTDPPFIATYFHHPPFGIETSYLARKYNRSLRPSQ